MPHYKIINFKTTTIAFILGLIFFYVTKEALYLTYWYFIVWIVSFLAIQFCGAYFIGLNFHLTSINKLPTAQKKVLLTFDDGPCNPYTESVLAVLKKHGIKAVFFIIGKNAFGNEELIKKIVADGHSIGNHSFSHHVLFDVWSTKKVIADLQQCQSIIQQYQPSSKLFRPPYGVTNPNISKAVGVLGLQSVGWNIRSYDTSIKDVTKIKQRILSQLKPGAIILLHDRLPFMPKLLEELILEIKSLGYEFDELKNEAIRL